MFLSIAEKRRSIRKFVKKGLEPEKIEVLMEAALRAPSSNAGNPWEFIIVTEPELLDKLSQSKQWGAAFLKDAPFAIVVCADPKKSGVWVEDCSIACIYIQLAAESIGLGSCWVQIRERKNKEGKSSEEVISELLNIPKEMKIEAIIAVGHPDEHKDPHTKEELQFEKFHLNSYGKKYER